MRRLLKHELYKLFQSLTLKVMIAVTVGVALISSALLMLFVKSLNDTLDLGLGGVFGLTGSHSVASALSSPSLHIYFAVMITLIVCSELRSKTMKNTLLADFSRGEVYFAKFLTTITAITVLILIHTVIFVVSAIAIFGWGAQITVQSILVDVAAMFFMGLLLCCAVAAMLNFFAYLLQNTALVILIAVIPILINALVIETLVVLGSGFFQAVNKVSYFSVLSNFAADKTLTNFAYYAVTMLVMLTGFTAGGYFVFKKKELK